MMSTPTMGPTLRGVTAVILNPGAWIFFATTASAVIADATADGGRDAAVAAAFFMTLGVSLSDFMFTLLGSGGERWWVTAASGGSERRSPSAWAPSASCSSRRGSAGRDPRSSSIAD